MVGLRERKKADTRSALSWAAIRLVVERGYDQVRVEDIAAAADVSPRTFNNYFSGKAEAITARHLDRLRAAAVAFRDRPSDEPVWDSITVAALAVLTPGPEVRAAPPGEHADWVAGLRVMMAEPALQAEMLRAGTLAEAELAAAVAARTGTDLDHQLYPHLVAAAVNAAISVASQHYVRSDLPLPMDRLLRDALAQFAAGLPEPGRAR